MGKAGSVKLQAPIEWLNWVQAMRVLRAAKVGARPWAVLLDWCGQGLIEGKVTSLTGKGKVRRDVKLEAMFWRACIYEDGPRVDPFDGSIRWAHRDAETNEPVTVTMVGPLFRKDQLLHVVSHVDAATIDAALTDEGGWLDRPKPAAAASEALKVESNRGRKPEKERWHAFWFVVIELAQEERLNADCFNSANALIEEIQELMGESAFDRDYIKATVGQIFKKFIGG